MNKIHVLNLEELLRFRKENPEAPLVNVLTPEQCARQHIPGSCQACVFEVAFPDHMQKIAPKKDTPVILYGAGNGSMDAHTAGQKLLEAGYSNIYVFEGGFTAWQEAGYPLEGEAPDANDAPYSNDTPIYKNYKLAPEQSRLAWVGRASGHQHWGSLGLKSGWLTFAGAQGKGTLTANMQAIKCDDLAGDKALHQQLIEHLSSKDFFLNKIFPEASLEVLELKPKQNAGANAAAQASAHPNYYGKGELTLLGKKGLLEGELSVRNLSEGRLSLTGQVRLDRTKWGIIYGSASFFRFLGMHRIDDVISLDAMLIFLPDGDTKNV